MVLYNSCFERDKREFQKTFKKVLTLIIKLDIKLMLLAEMAELADAQD